MRGRIAVAALALTACQSTQKTPTVLAPGRDSTGSPMFLRTGSAVAAAPMERATLATFMPDLPFVDTRGQCELRRTAGSGATSVTATFPNRDSARTSVTLSFDSVGNLVRYSERRGPPIGIVRVTRTMTQTQRDSVMLSQFTGPRSTTIGLDYATDHAFAMNMGGGKPGHNVSGTVRELENVDTLGPPRAHLQMVRRLCGV